MNFTDQIKTEILSKQLKADHCKRAFIAGLIRGSGVLYEKDEQLGLEFKVGDEQTAMMLTLSFKNLFNYDIREVSVSEDKVTGKERYYLNVSGKQALNVLKELEILVEDQGEIALNLDFYGKLTDNDCCLRSFIRGLFVASGRCTLPTENNNSSTGYHLEINFSHYEPAHDTSEKLAQNNVLTKITKRRDGYILYIKSAEEIKDFLAFLPAPISVLKLTDLMVNREFFNNINRQKNCDIANVGKQVEASSKQIDAIKKISETVGLESLKLDLRKTADARLENPEDTLNELAEKLKVSKSCLNHRLRKIIEIASTL